MGNGFDYFNPITLYKTSDGITFEHLTHFNIKDASETTIRLSDNDVMYALVRKERHTASIGKSLPPYTDWSFTNLDYGLAGQNFLFLNDSTLCIGARKYIGATIYDQMTVIYITDLNGNIKKEIGLESGFDSSYPAFLIVEDELWVSYYSSHENERQSSIYLAKIPLINLFVEK
ncbi:MAG TPA: hypothetical protein VJY12_07830 [Dysgonamonadaceae bacterium]|nr:hypothetical protein [Dysgonamonadaceae bacterium]